MPFSAVRGSRSSNRLAGPKLFLVSLLECFVADDTLSRSGYRYFGVLWRKLMAALAMGFCGTSMRLSGNSLTVFSEPTLGLNVVAGSASPSLLTRWRFVVDGIVHRVSVVAMGFRKRVLKSVIGSTYRLEVPVKNALRVFACVVDVVVGIKEVVEIPERVTVGHHGPFARNSEKPVSKRATSTRPLPAVSLPVEEKFSGESVKQRFGWSSCFHNKKTARTPTVNLGAWTHAGARAAKLCFPCGSCGFGGNSLPTLKMIP